MIVLGLDPGPACTGWAMVECHNLVERPRFFEGGHATTDEALTLIRTCGALRIAIEWPAWSVLPNAKPQQLRGIGKHLTETGIVAGQLWGFAYGRTLLDGPAWIAGPEALPRPALTARVIRRSLCGRDRATDAEVKAALTLNTTGLPKRSNVHVRDALAAAVVGWRMFGA